MIQLDIVAACDSDLTHHARLEQPGAEIRLGRGEPMGSPGLPQRLVKIGRKGTISSHAACDGSKWRPRSFRMPFLGDHTSIRSEINRVVREGAE